MENLSFKKSQDKDLDLICLSSCINDLKSNMLMTEPSLHKIGNKGKEDFTLSLEV